MSGEILDARSFYDRLAPSLESYGLERKWYFEAVNDLIVECCGNSVKSMLDVGCGDGRRATRIANRVDVQELVLLDESERMLVLAKRFAVDASLWRADISDSRLEMGSGFDLVTCLWNVLGHVPGVRRLAALLNMERALAPGGRLFLDVNNRYNARAYGWRRVAGNVVRDFFNGNSGEVVVSISVEDWILRTRSHVFSRREMRRLFQAAGLKVVNEWFVDYKTGELHRTQWSGQLLYELVPNDYG